MHLGNFLFTPELEPGAMGRSEESKPFETVSGLVRYL
jgi:hypothetical protein